MAIRSFGDKRTEKVFRGEQQKRLDAILEKKAFRCLRRIDSAVKIDDLRFPPSHKLEKKKGDLKDFHAIWVNTQWSIIFRREDGNAYDVRLVDYH